MLRPHTEAGVLYLQELKMIADFRKPFTRRSIEDTASDELYEAEKSLLIAQTKLEFAKATVDTETARVARLRAFVQAKGEANARVKDLPLKGLSDANKTADFD